MSFYIRFFLACLLLLTACESKERNSKALSGTESFDMEAPTRHDKQWMHDSAQVFFQKQFNKVPFNGHFLVAKNGHILFSKSTGYADFEHKIKLSPLTPIHVASISKVATALAVLRLVDQKKIKLNAKVTRYLKSFPYPEITVKSLLNHRSGLPYYGYFTNDACRRNSMLNNDSILEIMVKHKVSLNFPTNKKFAYSNTNFVILALIVEEVTGLPFPKAMQKLIFNPLKMEHSYVLSSYEDYKKAAKNYNANHFPYPFGYLDAIYGDKNLYTTAKDLMTMDKATCFNHFLSDSLRNQMYKGYSYEFPGTRNYGLGTRLKEQPGKKTFFFHTGWWHGNTGLYGSLRKDTVCIVAISNVFDRRVYNLNDLILDFGNYCVRDSE